MYSVTAPSVLMRPMPLDSVNHRAPSGPAVMPWKPPQQRLPRFSVYSVVTPCVSIRPTLPGNAFEPSVNHKAPSGPLVIPMGTLLGLDSVKSVMLFQPNDEPDAVPGASAGIGRNRDSLMLYCADTT